MKKKQKKMKTANQNDFKVSKRTWCTLWGTVLFTSACLILFIISEFLNWDNVLKGSFLFMFAIGNVVLLAAPQELIAADYEDFKFDEFLRDFFDRIDQKSKKK